MAASKWKLDSKEMMNKKNIEFSECILCDTDTLKKRLLTSFLNVVSFDVIGKHLDLNATWTLM
jgi:hypothetical protein